MNVGASNSEEGGYYFSWGNLDGHYLNDETTTDGDYSFDTNTYANSVGHFITTNLPLSYDPARAIMGGLWRTPTANEMRELFQYCSRTLYNGCIILSRNGNSIIMPRFKSRDNKGVYGLDTDAFYATSTCSDREGNMFGLWTNVNTWSVDDGFARSTGLVYRAVISVY